MGSENSKRMYSQNAEELMFESNGLAQKFPYVQGTGVPGLALCMAAIVCIEALATLRDATRFLERISYVQCKDKFVP